MNEPNKYRYSGTYHSVRISQPFDPRGSDERFLPWGKLQFKMSNIFGYNADRSFFVLSMG